MKARLPQNKNPIQKYSFLYHFIPQNYERKRARLLSHGALIAYTLVLSVTLVLFKFVPEVAPGILGYASNINTSDLLRYTNERRAKIGLRSLKINQELSNAAHQKAKDMFSVGYWAHVSPKGTEPWDFILGSGYDYIYAGENLAKNFSNSKEVVQAWYDSPTHRDNLLNKNYEEIGFAVVNGVLDGYETTIVVQMFGKAKQPVHLASAGPAGVKTSEEGGSLGVGDSVSLNTEKAEPIPVPMEEPVIADVKNNSEVLLRDQGADNLSYINLPQEQSNPLVDIRTVSTSITFVFGGFITSLLGIDIWYSKKHGALKFTGHTAAHLTFLLVILAGIMMSIIPGAVL